MTDSDGTQLGVMETRDAMNVARGKDLDLVEISPTAKPPVCRIMDYGKWQYEQGKKKRAQRRSQSSHSVKEVKFRPNVGDHDYQTKINHLREFLEKGHKVKISLMFRGRENAHRELGFAVVERAIKDCEDLAVVDSAPRRMGRQIIAMLGIRAKK